MREGHDEDEADYEAVSDDGEDLLMLDGNEDDDNDGFLDAFADSIGHQTTVKGICY